MLILKRMQHFNEFQRCNASGKILMYGDFYYEDTETGKIIDAKYYQQLKDEKKKETFDSSLLEYAQNDKEYREELRKAEEEYLTNTMFDKDRITKWGEQYLHEYQRKQRGL